MRHNDQPASGGVVVPPETVAASDTKKKQQKRTLAQLPVYRAAGNLLYVVAEIVKVSPKSHRKFFDLMLCDSAELCKAIGMAEVARNVDDRVWYIDSALVLMNSEKMYFTILKKLEVLPSPKRRADSSSDGESLKAPKVGKIDVINTDLVKKVDSLVKSIVAQLVAWRNNPRGEGVSGNPKDYEGQSAA